MDIRTLVLGLGVFCATFLIGWWLNIGAFIYGTGASHARSAAAVPVTAGQGEAQRQPAQRSNIVTHVPLTTSSQTPSAQPKVAQAKLPQVKYAQEPQAKADSPKRGLRIRIGRR